MPKAGIINTDHVFRFQFYFYIDKSNIQNVIIHKKLPLPSEPAAYRPI